jgi:hypothetical protein
MPRSPERSFPASRAISRHTGTDASIGRGSFRFILSLAPITEGSEAAMTIALLIDYAGTSDQYDEALKRLGFSTGGPGPEGNLMHWATLVDDAQIRAVDVWESQAHADAFYNGPLAAILKDQGVEPPTSVVSYDIYDYQIAQAQTDRR